MLLYLVTLTTAAKGRLALGYIDAKDKRDAQKQVVGWLQRIGVQKSELAIQVTDFTEISLHGHTIAIQPLRSLHEVRTLLDLIRPLDFKSPGQKEKGLPARGLDLATADS